MCLPDPDARGPFAAGGPDPMLRIPALVITSARIGDGLNQSPGMEKLSTGEVPFAAATGSILATGPNLMLNHPTILALAVVYCVTSGAAQDRASPTPLRITTTKGGLHAITHADLSPHWDLVNLVPARLALRRNGVLVPLDAEGLADGTFDRGDVLVFHAPEAGRSGRREIEFTLSADGGGRRFESVETSREGAVDESLLSVPLGVADTWAGRESIDAGWSEPATEPQRWILARLLAPLPQQGAEDAIRTSATSFTTAMDPPPLTDRTAKLVGDLLAPPVAGLGKNLTVLVNGRLLGTVEWSTTGTKHFELACDPGVIKSANTISLVNRSEASHYTEDGNELARKKRAFVEVHALRLEVTSLLYGPGNPEEQVTLRILPAAAPRRLAVAARSRHAWKVYDVSRGLVARDHRIALPANTATELVAGGLGSLKAVSAVTPMATLAATLPTDAPDWVCLTATRFRAHAETLARHRASQGLKTHVLTSRDARDAVAAGNLDPETPRLWLRELAKARGRAPQFLLLLGDADRDTDRLSEREVIPAFLTPTLYNGATAADALLGDLDGDGLPEVAVGRISARNDEALRELVVRILKLETRPAPGTWRSELSFCAGEGGFSPAIDGALKTMATGVLTRELPAHLALKVLDAGEALDDEALAVALGRRLDEGALCFTYAGHAQRTALAPRVKSKLRVLLPAAARTVAAGGRSPLALLLACSAGEFDAPGEDCLGEELLFARDGLTAVIASTRISHPFPNALLGRALAKSVFREATIGAALLAAHRSIAADAGGTLAQLAGPFLSKSVDRARLVRDHVALYALLGDPAMRLPVPQALEGLAVEGTVAAGTDLVLTGQSPFKGRLTARVEAGSPSATPTAACARAELDVDGSFRIVLPLRADLAPGTLRVHIHIEGAAGEAAAGNLTASLPAPR